MKPLRKYRNVRVQVDGIWFDSKREAARYNELKLLLAAKQIRTLDIHPRYPIEIEGTKICTVVLDFTYEQRRGERWEEVHEDIKGKDNALSRLKRKLVEAQYGIKVEVIR